MNDFSHQTHQITSRETRSDGLVTRNLLLRCAGEMFAERGYGDTTSKEVCERANATLGSVNYHFGSKAGLYREVLHEMTQYILHMDTLEVIAASQRPAREKLEQILDMALATQASQDWQVRLFFRELTSPSAEFISILRLDDTPEIDIIKRILGEIVGKSADSAVVNQCLLSMFSLCSFPYMVDSCVLENCIAPASCEAALLHQHIKRFFLAGLDALAAQS